MYFLWELDAINTKPILINCSSLDSSLELTMLQEGKGKNNGTSGDTYHLNAFTSMGVN